MIVTNSRDGLRALARDRSALGAVAALAGIAVLAAFLPAEIQGEGAAAAVRALFSAISAAVCLSGARAVANPDERRFWILLSASLLIVLGAELVSMVPSGAAGNLTAFAVRGLLVLAYAPLMAGVARFAGGRVHAGTAHLSAWTRPGLLVITTAGWLVYAAVLPFVDGSRSAAPQWYTFTALDLVIVGGFFGAGSVERTPRWYTLQRWLLATFTVALAINVLTGASGLSPLLGRAPGAGPFLWLLPHAGVILSARLRHHLPNNGGTSWQEAAQPSRHIHLPDTTLLILAAFSLPVAHTVALVSGLASTGARSPQDITVAVATLLLGLLAANEYRAMDAARTALARERRDVERALLQMQKMEAIGRLGGGIAHDFNNLLTAIGGYADIVRDGLSPSDPVADAMARVLTSVDRASSLTQQLLAVGRRQRLRAEAVDVNEVVRDLPFAHRHLLRDQIEFIPDLAADLRPAWVDAAQFEQVLVNLVVNARDAMSAGGVLRVTTRNVDLEDGAPVGWPESKAGRYVRLQVGDTGTGMPDDVLARVFEPFFTTKPQGSGTGLGLAIVYGIVRQSGGRIRLTSAMGHGTTATVDIPAAAASPARGGVAAPVQAVGTETILVAEDEQAVRELVQSMLRLGGYHVLPAGSGEEALHAARTHRGPIHLLLTDVVMPGINGRQLAERLTRERPDVRVLYMSGYTDDMSVRTGVLDGVVALLPKPFTRQALLDAVRHAIDAGTTGARSEGDVS